MNIERSLLENYSKIDAELVWRMVDDGLFEIGDLFSFVDMVFKVRTRGALLVNDFREIADVTAFDKAAALRIIIVYKSNKNPEMNFVRLGHNGIDLYSKFGLKEEFATDIKPLHMVFSSLELVLAMNHYLIKNELHYLKFIEATGPVITKAPGGEEVAYAYPEFIESIKKRGLYQGRIVPIYDEAPRIPWDMRCESCDSVAELRIAISNMADGKVGLLQN